MRGLGGGTRHNQLLDEKKKMGRKNAKHTLLTVKVTILTCSQCCSFHFLMKLSWPERGISQETVQTAAAGVTLSEGKPKACDGA